jgi:hypothetical protein
MINIHEFRIGNYVLADNVIRRVCLINNDPGITQTQGIGYLMDDDCHYEKSDSPKLSAVILTDEVLEEFGFNFHEHYKLWQHPKPANSYTIELDRDYNALDFSHRPILKNIKHFHILQNLFYTIQGEELVN